MDTIVKTESLGRRHRRTYDPAFKADVVAACQQPGVSVAAVALSHGLNANLLRRWVAEHERFGHHELEHEAPTQRGPNPAPAISFVPVKLAAPPAPSSATIQIEVRRGATNVNIVWPVGAAADCAAWLRELVQ